MPTWSWSAAATAAYRKPVALEPSYVAPRFNLGVLALKAGDHAGAAPASAGTDPGRGASQPEG